MNMPVGHGMWRGEQYTCTNLLGQSSGNQLSIFYTESWWKRGINPFFSFPVCQTKQKLAGVQEYFAQRGVLGHGALDFWSGRRMGLAFRSLPI